MVEELTILKKYISKLVEVPQEEWDYYITKFSLINLKKGETFFQQEEPIDKVGFLTSGLLKNFHSYPDGKEWIRSFTSENSIITDYCALLQRRSAIFTCEAMENSTLLIISFQDILLCHARHTCWQKFDLINLSRLLVGSENRIYQEVSLSAKEKWSEFKIRYLKIVHRVPKYTIARYLGITPEAFSRIINEE